MLTSGTFCLTGDSSLAWVTVLDQFKEEATTTRRRTFRLTTDLVLVTAGGERIELARGTEVTLFCFMSGSYKKTRRTFRVEGSFFLNDRVVSISGQYGNEPTGAPGSDYRKVTVTLYDDMRRSEFVAPLRYLVNV